MYIDSHCHLNKEYFADPGQVARDALSCGVGKLVFASADIATSREAIDFANSIESPAVYALAGVHPHEAQEVNDAYLAELAELLSRPRVVGLGEIGLDYFYDISPRNVQERIFTEQLELALEKKIPVIIHVRDGASRTEADATTQLLKILESYKRDLASGIIHCFSAQLEDALWALELGFYISFSCTITYPKNQFLREAAMAIPLDKLLCETDSPYLAPQKLRGTTNEPKNVLKVYETIALLRGMEQEKLAEQVEQNIHNLFGI